MWVTITIVLIVFAVAASAFGLSLAAFLDGQSENGHQDWTRRNVYVRSDLVVEGESRLEGSVFANSDLYVDHLMETAALKTNTLAWNSFYVITSTGAPPDMSAILKTNSCIRIDTPGAGIVTLPLPKASAFPGQTVTIMISQLGSAATVNLTVTGGDAFVDRAGTATSTNPVATYPRNAGQPDSVVLTNDGVSVWYTV